MEQAMQPLGNRYGLKGTQSIKPLVTRQTESQGTTTLNIHPPMVVPKRSPDTIMFSILGSDEEEMGRFLATYQKTHPEWDVFRKKIPDELLRKFQRVLQECKAEGYVNPHMHEEKIVWQQILTRERHKNASDQCTLCPRSLAAGDCRGRMRKNFQFCWSAK